MELQSKLEGPSDYLISKQPYVLSSQDGPLFHYSFHEEVLSELVAEVCQGIPAKLINTLRRDDCKCDTCITKSRRLETQASEF